MQLPLFTLVHYEALLDGLAANGCDFARVSELASRSTDRTVFLRHDIDLHLDGIEQMAELEAKRGIAASYYIPLTLHFNPAYAPNAAIVKALVGMGHEVGLHYDLSVFDASTTHPNQWLRAHVQMLEIISGIPVKTICLHQPHQNANDPFVSSDDYVNPSDPRLHKGLTYVSDSCRAWRDEALLAFLRPDAKGRLLLTTHPEVWLAAEDMSRFEFLSAVLKPNALRQHERYFDDAVRHVWTTHVAPRMHDEREANAKKQAIGS
jgi:hypothetical protein